jgi:hypothetical protein
MDTVVSPDTLLRWYRRLIAEKWNFVHRRGPGRPAIMQQISALIVRMAQDNPGPGFKGRAPTVVNTRCCADRIEGASAGAPGRTADAASRLPASNSGVTRSGRRRGGPSAHRGERRYRARWRVIDERDVAHLAAARRTDERKTSRAIIRVPNSMRCRSASPAANVGFAQNRWTATGRSETVDVASHCSPATAVRPRLDRGKCVSEQTTRSASSIIFLSIRDGARSRGQRLLCDRCVTSKSAVPCSD